jgi:hypothetical protein
MLLRREFKQSIAKWAWADNQTNEQQQQLEQQIFDFLYQAARGIPSPSNRLTARNGLTTQELFRFDAIEKKAMDAYRRNGFQWNQSVAQQVLDSL